MFRDLYSEKMFSNLGTTNDNIPLSHPLNQIKLNLPKCQFKTVPEVLYKISKPLRMYLTKKCVTFIRKKMFPHY